MFDLTRAITNALSCGLAATAMIFASGTQVLGQDKASEETLAGFYEATNGDDWHNNDGWLDTEVDPCDWFGVTCEPIDEDMVITRLELPGNNLQGELETLPGWVEELDLSHNALEGDLPAMIDGPVDRLTRLNLAGNRFSGGIPESWAELELSWLDLSNNELDAAPENGFAALAAEGPGYLNLADNLFAGALPASVMDTSLQTHDETVYGGGLNLCWNELVFDDPDLDDWVRAHHVGGDYAGCVDRNRQTVDIGISGNWYVPERSGKGLVLHMLQSGIPMLYSFSFDTEGRQQWMLGLGTPGDYSVTWNQLMETRGEFGQGITADDSSEMMRPGAALRIDRTGPMSMHAERVYYDWSGCDFGVGVCVPEIMSERLEHVQLERLAGTSCFSRQPHQWISGVWYDPARSGEGFVIEVIEDGRGVVYWFTYEPDGSTEQAWMIGIADFDGTVLHLNNLVRPDGGQAGPDHDSDAISSVHWGTLTLEFHNSQHGHVQWNSVMPEFGSGEYPIQRLTRPLLVNGCDDD